MVGFIIGFLIGGMVGFVLAAVFAVAGREDLKEELYGERRNDYYLRKNSEREIDSTEGTSETRNE